MKLRIKLWPDLCCLTSEQKHLKIHAYVLYKDCPFRLHRVATGGVVTGSGKRGSSCAEEPSLFFVCQ